MMRSVEIKDNNFSGAINHVEKAVKDDGFRTVDFELNGMMRSVEIKDNNFSGAINHVEKADMGDPLQIGARPTSDRCKYTR